MARDNETRSKWRIIKIDELESTPEFLILSKLVEQGDKTPTTAVKQILELTTLNRGDPDDLEGHLVNTACSLIELSERSAPEQQSNLVTFVAELSKNTILDPNTGEPLIYAIDRNIVWTGFPAFSWTFGDALRSVCMPSLMLVVAKSYQSST